MKKNIIRTIAMAALSLFIGFSSIAAAKPDMPETSGTNRMVVTLPEVVCTAEKASVQPETGYKEYLNEAMGLIRDNLERFQLKNIMEEVNSILRYNTL